ncbi:hypothetical protein ABTF02_18555, partial [Acinetobacter baumannii]
WAGNGHDTGYGMHQLRPWMAVGCDDLSIAVAARHRGKRPWCKLAGFVSAGDVHFTTIVDLTARE